MSVLVDTSILVDLLRGRDGAVALARSTGIRGVWQASEITRLEVLAGVRPRERRETTDVLSLITWHDVDREAAEKAGELGRRWLPSHHTIDAADLAIAATARLRDLPLLTLNVKHFPMMKGLAAPYWQRFSRRMRCTTASAGGKSSIWERVGQGIRVCGARWWWRPRPWWPTTLLLGTCPAGATRRRHAGRGHAHGGKAIMITWVGAAGAPMLNTL